jgi:membrane fusion protein, multidrug efflux system
MTLRRWLVLCLLIAVAIYFGSDYVIAYTDDAYVRSDFVPISSEIDGIIQSVAVSDNQLVHAGERLVTLNPDFYRLTLSLKQDQVASASAEVEEKIAAAGTMVSRIQSAQAALNLVQEDYDRITPLAKEQVDSQQKLDDVIDRLHRAQDRLAGARSESAVALRQVDTEKAAVATAKAEQALAAYQLSRTEIKAPVDGYVTNMMLRPGVYAKSGDPLIGIVDANRFHVIANFKEYVAASVKPGKSVWVWFDTQPWRFYRGRVESVARGIARSDTPTPLLPYVARSTNWIRLLRRLPVSIVLDPALPQNALYMGTDVRVLIIR